MTRRYFALSVLLLVACRQEQTQTTTTDSTVVTRDGEIDTIASSEGRTPAPKDTTVAVDTLAIEKGRQLMPVDNASRDKSFLEFREQLLNVVRAKDAKAIIGMLDTNIHLSFGGHGGIKDFREMWKPENKQSKLWTELEWILTHGGDFRKEAPGTFWAPYVYSNWPERGPDPFDYAAITAADVPVFEKADDRSKQVSRLNYHLVKGLEGTHLREDRLPYVKILTPEGKTGYVRSHLVRSAIDYRAGFDKRSGKWKMSILIAGD